MSSDCLDFVAPTPCIQLKFVGYYFAIISNSFHAHLLFLRRGFHYLSLYYSTENYFDISMCVLIESPFFRCCSAWAVKQANKCYCLKSLTTLNALLIHIRYVNRDTTLLPCHNYLVVYKAPSKSMTCMYPILPKM